MFHDRIFDILAGEETMRGVRVSTTLTDGQYGKILTLVEQSKFASPADYLRYTVVSNLTQRSTDGEFHVQDLGKRAHKKGKNKRRR